MTIEAAVVVDEGYRMNVSTQEMERRAGRYALFTDGSALHHLPDAAPDEFDVAASRSAEPNAWGTWSISGDALQLRWPGAEPESYDSWFRLETAARDERLDASYSVLGVADQGGDGAGSFFGTGWKRLVLSEDGHFARSQGGSADAGGTYGDVYAATSQDSRGRYRFDGATLELDFEDGHVERASAWFSSAERTTLLLNGVTMRRDRTG